MLKTIGERIKYVRQTEGETQAEFATRTGVSRSTVAKYEGSDSNPDAQFLEKLGNMNFSIEWVVTGKGSPNPHQIKLTDKQEKYAVLAGLVAGFIESSLQERGLRLKAHAFKRVCWTLYEVALEFAYEGVINLEDKEQWLEAELGTRLARHLKMMIAVLDQTEFVGIPQKGSGSD